MTDQRANPVQWAQEQARKLQAEEDERLRKIEQRATNAYEQNKKEIRAEEERRNPKVDIDEVRARKGRQELEQHRQTQHNLWIAHGGSDEDFKAAWPGIRQRYLEQKSAEAYSRASSVY